MYLLKAWSCTTATNPEIESEGQQKSWDGDEEQNAGHGDGNMDWKWSTINITRDVLKGKYYLKETFGLGPHGEVQEGKYGDDEVNRWKYLEANQDEWNFGIVPASWRTMSITAMSVTPFWRGMQ